MLEMAASPSVESAKSVESVESAASIQQVEPVVSVESVKPVESVEDSTITTATTPNSTRIVVVEAELSPSGLLVCKTRTMKFEDKVQYEALSYRWGEEISPEKIILDGAEHAVTQNLHDALEYFRFRKPGIPLWIDALSINQLDLSEKNQQLKIMPHIYFRAVTVLVWMGKKYVSEELSGEAAILLLDAGKTSTGAVFGSCRKSERRATSKSALGREEG